MSVRADELLAQAAPQSYRISCPLRAGAPGLTPQTAATFGSPDAVGYSFTRLLIVLRWFWEASAQVAAARKISTMVPPPGSWSAMLQLPSAEVPPEPGAVKGTPSVFHVQAHEIQ